MTSRLRRPDPTSLGYLGLLGLPGYVFEPLEPLRVFMLFWLFWLWPLVSVLFVSSDDEGPVHIEFGWRSKARYFLSSLFVMVNPFVFVQSSADLLGYLVGLVKYRGRLPTPERYHQKTHLTLPLEETWTVVNGGVEKEDSHSWSILSQRYAYDFLVTDDEGGTHRGDGNNLEDYYCYGEPLLAPADGVVISASDGHRDSPYLKGALDPFQRDIRGNYVTIEHATDEYSVLAHLQEGSVTVEEGERVERGQRVGRCGHSGNSTEPHLHFQLQDRPRWFDFAVGLPISFDEVTIDGEHETGTRQSVREGQRVERLRTETMVTE